MRSLYAYLFAGLLALAAGSARAQSEAYFQQTVNYDIRVELDDRNHFLRGTETFVYTNNSPNVLTEMYIHLWPNAYKDNTTAFARQQRENGQTKFWYAPEEDRGYIDSLDFRVKGKPLKWHYWQGNWDIALLQLAEPLRPGESVSISTPFRVKIPETFSRLGHIGRQYQITQWYPKPAVFDDEGWRPMPYLSQGEFYSEFGTFDVHITLPKNYVVGATGDLVNGAEEEAWLRGREVLSRQKLDAPAPEDGKPFDYEFPEGATKTLHFRQTDVHDFAWFCDKDYYVLTGRAELAGSGKKVKTVALFNERDKAKWAEANEYIAQGVYHYSKMVGDYPWKHCTAVDGALSAGAGMEYPNITVVGAGAGLRDVIIHEVGHNWFYGIFGTNERRYPWLDEGFNSYYEYRARDEQAMDEGETSSGRAEFQMGGFKLPGGGGERGQYVMPFYAYKFAESVNNAQPLQAHSTRYTMFNYGIIVYMKSVLALRYLERYLGQETYDRCMQTMFDRWKFKHPGPGDFERVFAEVSGKDVAWFFDGYVEMSESADFELVGARTEGAVVEARVRNNTRYPMPAYLVVRDARDSVLAEAWTAPFLGETTVRLALPLSGPEWRAAEVNPGQVAPERIIHDNIIFNQSLFRKWSRLNATLGIPLNQDAEEQTFGLSPASGYNTTDGFMLGAGVYFNPFPVKHFDGHALGMYGFASRKLAGSAALNYHIFRPSTSALNQIELGARTSHFAGLFRLKYSAAFKFRPPHPRDKVRNVLTLASHHIGIRGFRENEFDWQDDFRPYYVEAEWDYERDETIWSWGLNAELGGHDVDMFRGSIAPRLRFDYFRGKGEVKLRLFAGGVLSARDMPFPLEYRLSGSFDPFGEQIYLDRRPLYDERPMQSSWLDQQISEDQGAFKTILPVSSGRWLASGNANVKIPYVPIFRFFGDYGFAPVGGEAVAYYDAGLALNMFGDVLNVYFPLAGSVYADDFPGDWSNFSENITFSLRLDRALSKIPF